jgi:hypothetical protein
VFHWPASALWTSKYIRGPFTKFVDPPYYSEPELCGGAVTVSFFRITSLGKQCTSFDAPPPSRKRTADRWSLRNFLPRSSLLVVGKAQKSHGARSDWILCSAWKNWISRTPLEHPPYSPDLAPCDFWAFPTMKRKLRGKKFRSDELPTASFRKVGGAL